MAIVLLAWAGLIVASLILHDVVLLLANGLLNLITLWWVKQLRDGEKPG